MNNTAAYTGIDSKPAYESPFGHTLIVGAGPAAIQVAVHIFRGWCEGLGLINRKGAHSDRMKEELKKNGFNLTARVQGEKAGHLSGKATLTHFYEGYDQIDDIWQTVIFCTPSDSYPSIIDDLKLDSWKAVKTILLISPGPGSNLLVNSRLGKVKESLDVISLSTYYAATKFEPGMPSMVSCFTKALKKHLYVASSQKESTAVSHVKAFIESLGIRCTVVRQPIEAESRNVTTYVHPPLFINPFSLNEIFSHQKSNKYMYKIYPEGPVSQHSIHTMVLLWKEISAVIKQMGANPINLLKFLNDDNYPVLEKTLSRSDIETFVQQEPITQEYLLYIRYTSILIDPFSTPDDRGRYFDFSAVPYKQVYRDRNGKWVIPRVPYEDYKNLKLLYGLAQKMNILMPQTLELIRCFEEKYHAFIKQQGKDSFYPEQIAEPSSNDVDAIWSEMGMEK
ncbi:opine metallophore biosynthesis dehydrogenase [Desmospora profundinema]|uniref:DUF2338 family protein n=1 Tax=Desmospora profundinema TaxID=1571184 RepID=A0ABU1INF1_9BACL|nr:opine metallophore biosynthesis dehydrogenase [Desmospora profundinema]MDR6225699.1 hypothetical protein [Desmospora profundinema]